MNWKNHAYFLLVVGLLLFNIDGFSQEKKLWTKVDALESNEQLLVANTTTKHHQLFTLDVDRLKSKLRFNVKSNKASKIIELPDADGNFIKFKVHETSILHPDLAKKYPSIKSYFGQGLDDKSISVHFSTTALGLHAMVLSPHKATMFIDPYTKNRKKYKVYYKKDASTKKSFVCSSIEGQITKKAKKQNLKSAINDLKLRTFRLAIATTEEYSNFHVNAAGVGAGSTRADSINAVLSAIVVTMNRVNPIFERDIGITMQLVPNNDQLIYLETDPGNDPYTNNDGSAMLTQNQNNINSVIGVSNYDIGHVFSTGGGGVANIASVCGSSKAKGVTGSASPISDSFYIDYVAHEMGHQFGANHTFNGNLNNNCSNANRNDATAVEPGSGSTLMGYAGICGQQQNIQNNSDSYFHAVSIAEMYTNVLNGSSQCAAVSNMVSNFNLPTANAGSDFTIPKSTPFILKGHGSDADGDVLTYAWEQIDNEVNGISIPPSSTQTVGAIFRSFPPSLSPDRCFPKMRTLATGGNSTWEVLPSVSRSMNFVFTVRDNAVGGGQTAADHTVITVNDAAGPFVVTSQNNTGITWAENDIETITWDVAGTDGNGINESNVNILLSLDGGLTYPTVLLANTPNDGSEKIVVPNTPSPNARIMVQAVANVFFAINSEDISIGSFQTSCATYQSADIPKSIPDANTNGVVSTVGISDNFTVSDVNVALDITHSWLWDLQIYLKAPNGTEVLIYDRTCGSSGDQTQNIKATFDDGASAVVCSNANPAISGETKPTNLLSSFNGVSSKGNWQLKVVDNSSGDIGTINNWSLELCQFEQTVSVGEYDFQQLKIYPNPFNDVINISLGTDTYDEVSISLFDLTGRRVLFKKYNNQDTYFDKLLEVNDLSSGIYILKIQKGLAVTSKKIIKY